jgi:putative flippase GtrA
MSEAKRGARMFGKHSLASAAAFAFDLALLVALIEFAGLSWLPAATIAFAAANLVLYVLSRIWVFPDSDRGVATGLAYFMVVALIGLGVTLGTMALLVDGAGLHYAIGRVIASIAAGVVVFLLNAIFNFKALGRRGAH